MERVKFNFVPEWKGPIEGWVVNYVSKNIWRCGGEYDIEDLVQDAFLVYMMVRDRYPEIRTPQHFMSLFKTCFTNHVHAIANKRTKRAEVHLNDDKEHLRTLSVLEDHHPTDIDQKMFHLNVESVPAPVRRVIENLGIMNPEIRIGQKRNNKVLTNGTKVRETTNQFLCRLSGSDPDEVDMTTMVTKSLGVA